jgi:hypothetical protein
MAAGAGYRLTLLVDADAHLRLVRGMRRVLTATDTPPATTL